MSSSKAERVAKERAAADARRQKALVSLAHCLGRSDVYRYHHEGLVHELLALGGGGQFNNARKLRFAAYVCAWFSGLAAVIERFQQLVENGTLPPSDELAKLITAEFVDLLKPFRNAVAHCSDHDDDRVLNLLGQVNTIPDQAAAISFALKQYIERHSEKPIYSDDSDASPGPK